MMGIVKSFENDNALADGFPGMFLLSLVVFGTAGVFLIFGWHPIHDSINWFPFYEYFQDSLINGEIPFWNPFIHLGMPFFQNIQPLGLLEPTVLLTTPLQLFDSISAEDAHVIRNFVRFFVFISGVYWVLCIVTRDKSLSVILSVVLFFGVLPASLRQSGGIDNNMFVPLITALSILYFRGQTSLRKGATFFSLLFVLGAAMNNHIPSIPLLMFLIFFFMYAHFLGGGIASRFKEAFRRPLLPWTVLAFGTALFLVLPVIALYVELKTSPEIFGSLRLLNSNDGAVKAFFASELPDHAIFFEAFTKRVYLTINNLIGYATEPYVAAHTLISLDFEPSWIVWGTVSEMRLYLGIAVLLFAIIGASGWRQDRQTLIFGLLAVLTLLLSVGFDPRFGFAARETNGIQAVAFAMLPGTGLIEALQNTSVLFCFYLVVLAGLGWQKANDATRQRTVLISLILVSTKYIVLSQWTATSPFILSLLGDRELAAGLIILWSGYALTRKFKLEKGALFVVAGIDVLFFVVALAGFNIDTQLSEDLSKAGGVQDRHEISPAMYRSVFPESANLLRPEERHSIASVEMVSRKSHAFSAPLLREIGVRNQRFEQFFMTRSYYDFSANVPLEKQLIFAGVNNPVFNFYSTDEVVFVEDARTGVHAIKALPEENLARTLFIERSSANTKAKLSPEEISELFVAAPSHLGDSELQRRSAISTALYERGQWKRPIRPDVEISPKRQGNNAMVLAVKSSQEGWIYWADGYSQHWRARVNGQFVPIEKANINFKAVKVPAGESKITFHYDPGMLRIAFTIYFLTIGFCLIAFAAISIRVWGESLDMADRGQAAT